MIETPTQPLDQYIIRDQEISKQGSRNLILKNSEYTGYVTRTILLSIFTTTILVNLFKHMSYGFHHYFYVCLTCVHGVGKTSLVRFITTISTIIVSITHKHFRYVSSCISTLISSFFESFSVCLQRNRLLTKFTVFY